MKNIQQYFRNALLLSTGLGFGWVAQAQMVVVNVGINQPAALVANAGSPNGIELCEGDTVSLGGTPTASGGTGPFTYAWSPNTTLSGDTLANPLAWPASNATYTLQVTDANNCTSNSSVALTVSSIPVSAFNFNSNGLTVTFTDQSSGTVTDWDWDFGDGNTSTQQNPVHTYAAPGQYTICFTAYNNDCGQESCIVLTVIVGVEDEMALSGLQVAPNPYHGETQLRFTLTEAAQVRLEAYDMQGKLIGVVMDGYQDAGAKAVPFSAAKLGASAGMYLLRLSIDAQVGWVKVIEH